MKKTISLVTALLLIFSLAACNKADTSKWQSNDTFSQLVVYEYGDTLSAEFASEANIKIEDNNYDHFVKYIEQLKQNGFKYLKNGDIPENYNLNSGTASWRCTDGKIYLQLIFSEDGTSSREMFGCNLQIYGYSTKPESWGEDEDENESSAEKDTKQESTSEETTAKSAD